MPHLATALDPAALPPILEALDEISTGHRALLGICDLLASETLEESRGQLGMVNRDNLVTLLDLVVAKIDRGLTLART